MTGMSRRNKNNRRKNKTRNTAKSQRKNNRKRNDVKKPELDGSNFIVKKTEKEKPVTDEDQSNKINEATSTDGTAIDGEEGPTGESLLSVDDLTNDSIINDDNDGESQDIEGGYDDLDDETYDDIQEDVLVSNDGNGVIRSSNDLTDSLITYETDGFIDPSTGKPYSRFHLMAHPVKFVFKQHNQGDDPDDYETVGFVVNRSFAYEMSSLFENIRRAYDGQPIDRKNKVKENLTPDGIKRKSIRLIRDHPIQVGMTALVIIAIVVILFFV